MTLYVSALFLHVVGALGFFVALSLEWTSLRHLQRATTAEQVREWLAVFAGVRRVAFASLATLLLSGLYMTAAAWGWVAWVLIALAAIVLLAVLGATLTGRRMAAIGRAVAAESGSLSSALRHQLHDPFLRTSVQTRTAIALGIVFLMTVKPDLAGALLAIGAAIVLGLASSLPARGRDQAQEPAGREGRSRPALGATRLGGQAERDH
jgi:hypothetical protein